MRKVERGIRAKGTVVIAALALMVGCDGGGAATDDAAIDGGDETGDTVVTDASDTAAPDTSPTNGDGGGDGDDAGPSETDAADADASGDVSDSTDAPPVRMRLSIDPEAIEEELTDFPVLVHLGADSGTNGADTTHLFETEDGTRSPENLSFVTEPGGEPLYAEIESWDPEAREAWIWVKVPSVSADAETVFYLEHLPGGVGREGYVGETGTEAAANVWSNGFVGVYHLAQDGDGTSGEYVDSTVNAIHGTGGAGSPQAAPGSTDGKVGKAAQFDGEDDFIELPDHDGFSQPTTGELSISFWMARDSLNYPGRDYIRFIGKGIAGQSGDNGPNNHEWTFNMYNDNLDPFPSRRQRRSFYICDYQSGQCAGDYAQPEWEPYGPIPYIEEGEWFQYVGQVDERYVYAYNNGILGHDRVDYRNYGDNNISPNNENAPVRIGTRDRPESSGILHGKIDEFRISGSFRSEAWIAANYLNQADDLVAYEEATE